MNTLHATEEFTEWFKSIKDKRARNIILARLRRVIADDFGDFKTIKNGLSEMRIHYGAGFRIYFFRHQERIYILLGGGTKNRQQADIEKMISLMNLIKNG